MSGLSYPVLVYSVGAMHRGTRMDIPWPSEISFARVCADEAELDGALKEALSMEGASVCHSIVSLGMPKALAQMVHAGLCRQPKGSSVICE